jgi:hypothetical protein
MWCDPGKTVCDVERERMADALRQSDEDLQFCESINTDCPLFPKVVCVIGHVLGKYRVAQVIAKRGTKSEERKKVDDILNGIGSVEEAIACASMGIKPAYLDAESSVALSSLMELVKSMAEQKELARIQCIFTHLKIPLVIFEI